MLPDSFYFEAHDSENKSEIWLMILTERRGRGKKHAEDLVREKKKRQMYEEITNNPIEGNTLKENIGLQHWKER